MIGRLLLLIAAIAIGAGCLWGLTQIPYNHRGISTLIGVVGGGSLVIVFVIPWQVGNDHRTRRLARENPESIVKVAVRTPQLVVALRERGVVEPLPVGLTIVVSRRSISFWGGMITLRKCSEVEFEEIDSVIVADVRSRVRSFRGLEISLGERSMSAVLPIIITGSGPLGANPPSYAALTKLAEEITARVETSRQSQ
jgi:hypothetical protein